MLMLKSNAAFVTFCAFPQISGIKLPLKMSVLNRTHSEEVATFETVKHQQSLDNTWSVGKVNDWDLYDWSLGQSSGW